MRWGTLYNNVHQVRKDASGSRKKGAIKPDLKPPRQDLVASLFVPGGGTFSVSTADYRGPVTYHIREDIHTAAPLLWNALRGAVACGRRKLAC